MQLAILVLQCIDENPSNTTTYTFPILRNTIPFVFNGLEFLGKARRDIPGLSTIRIPIFRDDIYLARGPKNCMDLFQNPHFIVTRAYSLVLQQCFGMNQGSVDAYIADTSGSRQKPIPGSNPNPQDRISFMTHHNLVKGLLQEGYESTAKRFMSYLSKSLDDEQKMHEAILGDSWRDEADLSAFFQEHIGSSLINTLFGETLLEDHPAFLDDLWEYDDNVIKLIQRLPHIWIQKTYQIRDSLKAAVKEWHRKATLGRKGSSTENLWGTQMMKERYQLLMNATGQDEDSVASTDLALIWASVTNVVPSTTTLALQIFKSQSITSAVEAHLSALPQPPSWKDVESIPLLNSMYAETLRYGVQIHIPRTSPNQPVSIGDTTIPTNKLLIANTWFEHTNEDIWNTRNGEHPLNEFWPERFIVDPHDRSSGPAKHPRTNNEDLKGPQFSLDGLEGAFIPFGGGQHACPGRLLAKRIMIMSVAHLIQKFEIEIDHDAGDRALEYSSERFGFGVRTPRGPVRFRIRRKKTQGRDGAHI
ncbi:cytochrome P450 [Pestalotiopsis sp. NC0098]|nr:cytochrome P450 [Pestalotiopsis sp. NC0098]